MNKCEREIQQLINMIENNLYKTEILDELRLNLMFNTKIEQFIIENGLKEYIKGFVEKSITLLIEFQFQTLTISNHDKYNELIDLQRTCKFFNSANFKVFYNNLGKQSNVLLSHQNS
jgi:hypothetical protein